MKIAAVLRNTVHCAALHFTGHRSGTGEENILVTVPPDEEQALLGCSTPIPTRTPGASRRFQAAGPSSTPAGLWNNWSQRHWGYWRGLWLAPLWISCPASRRPRPTLSRTGSFVIPLGTAFVCSTAYPSPPLKEPIRNWLWACWPARRPSPLQSICGSGLGASTRAARGKPAMTLYAGRDVQDVGNERPYDPAVANGSEEMLVEVKGS